MTLTITNGQILIADPWIDALVAGTDTVTITYTYNCASTSTTVTPTAADINASNQYPLDVSEGPYYITLTNTTDANNLQSQSLCAVYLSDTTKATVQEKIQENCDIKLASYYTALTLTNSCECQCEKVCKIYSVFSTLISDNECNC